MRIRNFATLVIVGLWASTTSAQRALNPFAPSLTKLHAERVCRAHTESLAVSVLLNWPQRTISGLVTLKMQANVALAGEISLDAGPAILVDSCKIDGVPAAVRHLNDSLAITLRTPLAAGTRYTVECVYHTAAGSVIPGFHWVVPRPFEPERKPAFWTNGWPETNHTWLPCYDFPNDRAMLDERVTAPSGWYVMGNGELAGVMHTPTTVTYHWKMNHPVSTYLVSLSGGEMDVRQAKDGGVSLQWAVPKGEAGLIKPTFLHTADMVQTYEALLQTPFPWPKYGQTAVLDFIFGGMENVSCTTLTENGLVEARDPTGSADGLVAHELAHQWFGDMVTYRDWSQAWLSEGFATFMTMAYEEKSQGKWAYQRAREGAMRSYLAESRRYRRPIVTVRYRDANSMLDSHTYQKGALVLHMLRRELGDTAFFTALHDYLQIDAFRVVGTSDFESAVERSCGRNLHSFFQQWIYSPGHPVVQYRWTVNSQHTQVHLVLNQVQTRTDGVGLFQLDVPVAAICGGKIVKGTVRLRGESAAVDLSVPSSPDAVLLDPEHDLIIERTPPEASSSQQLAILRYAPSTIDRELAANWLLEHAGDAVGTAEVVKQAAQPGDPALTAAVLRLAAHAPQERARGLYRQYAASRSPQIRAGAVTALASLARTAADTQATHRAINLTNSIPVVEAAVATLNGDADTALLAYATEIPSRRDAIAVAAASVLSRGHSSQAARALQECTAPGRSRRLRLAATNLLGSTFRGLLSVDQTLRRLEADADPAVRIQALAALAVRTKGQG